MFSCILIDFWDKIPIFLFKDCTAYFEDLSENLKFAPIRSQAKIFPPSGANAEIFPVSQPPPRNLPSCGRSSDSNIHKQKPKRLQVFRQIGELGRRNVLVGKHCQDIASDLGPFKPHTTRPG